MQRDRDFLLKVPDHSSTNNSFYESYAGYMIIDKFIYKSQWEVNREHREPTLDEQSVFDSLISNKPMPIISQRRVVQVVATRGDALYILPPELCDKEMVLTAVRQHLGMDLQMI